MKVPSRACLSALVLCVASISLVDRAEGTELEEIAQLIASDAEGADNFGQSVSVEGDVALIGATGASGFAGSAYVSRFDGSTWVEEQKLAASDAASFDLFGVSVALSGDVALIGAQGDDDNGLGSGSAYVYRFDGLTWVEEQKLTASDGATDSRFGASVSLSGDVALIGAEGDDGFTGSAYVFRFDGSTWVEEQKLAASDPATSDFFGVSVSLSGDMALVGAQGDDGFTGSAYVYRFDGSTWVEEQKLTASDPAASDFFGVSVSLSGDVALIGAQGDDGFTGSAYVYRFDGSTWVEEQKLTASDAAGEDRFGVSVSLSGDVALIGASVDDGSTGSAYVYRSDGSTWAEEQKLTASNAAAGDLFGISVAVNGDVALIGARDDDDHGSNSGSAYVFFGANCLIGTVNAANGSMTDTLYINGSTGGADRAVEVAEDDLIVVTMVLPPDAGNGKFVLHADLGAPTLHTQAILPFDVGTSCFPFLLTAGATPVIVANNIGKTSLVGASEFFGIQQDDPERATTSFAYFGLPMGTTVLTFQGLIVDPGAVSAKGVSLTNGVIATLVP